MASGWRSSTIDPKMIESTTGVTIKTPPIHLTAGPRRVTAAFIQHFEGPVIDLIAPIEHTLADTQIGVAYGITTLPHLKDMSIVGPYRVTRRVRDADAAQSLHLPPDVAGRGGDVRDRDRQAPRQRRFPASGSRTDLASLMKFYESERQGEWLRKWRRGIDRGDSGESAVSVSPRACADGRRRLAASTASATSSSRRGSRSFCGARRPTPNCGRAPANAALRLPAELERQTRRMLRDERAEALATRFAAQWLRLQDVDEILPDALLYPVLRQHARQGVSARDRSSFSKASSARIAACWICSRPTIPSSTSASRSTTAFRTSPETASSACRCRITGEGFSATAAS